MPRSLTTAQSSLESAIRSAIAQAIPGAEVSVEGGGGHFTLDVLSPAFEGKSRVARQRLVLQAIAHLMKGDGAPVHAIDTLTTRTT